MSAERVTDEDMKRLLLTAKPYTVAILRPGPNRHRDGADKIIWEHGRRNIALRAEGSLSVVLPIGGGSDVSGIGVFNHDIDTTRDIIAADPGVIAGVFVYDLYETRSFPGDSLPA